MSDHNERILVYGAAGVQGNAVAKQLLEIGYDVRTLVRSEAKAEQLRSQGFSAVIGDLADVNSLHAAHQGVSKVLLLLPVDFNLNRLKNYVSNALEAAKRANIALLVFNASIFVPETTSDSTALEIKRVLIDEVKNSGIPSIILLPTLYLENLYIPGILAGSTLAYPVPSESPIPWISIAEAAAFSVEALQKPELSGQTIAISGAELLTGNQLAQSFSHTLGRNIQFVSLPIEAFEQAIKPFVGEETSAGLSSLYRWIADNHEQLQKQGDAKQLPRSLESRKPLSSWIEQSVRLGFFSS
ncbi:NmrA family NAD(P)-binding protein [Paenibacillus sp. LjRoot153]|uniref:SDR family oxidoreductase n=1 Tax=Paenibacillus sp. LjRoot153 TaxID=3342270 RepID=UPI003ED016B7